MTNPKLWNDRDFDECCYPVSGYGRLTMVCAEPSAGAYCDHHRAVMDMSVGFRPRTRPFALKVERPATAPKVKVPRSAWEPDRRVKEVRAAVAAKHRLSVTELLNGGPSQRYAPARQEACWAIRQLGRSYPQVAKSVGLSDHTSAMHACRRHEARMAASRMEMAA